MAANANYTLSFTGANLTITSRSASVTALAASKIFADADPVLTGTLSGFLISDGVTADYSRTSGEDLGTYTISASLSATGLLGNYDIAYITAPFLITTPDNQLLVAVNSEGTLLVNGTNNAEKIEIKPNSDGTISVKVNDKDAHIKYRERISGVSKIIVHGMGGNDDIKVLMNKKTFANTQSIDGITVDGGDGVDVHDFKSDTAAPMDQIQVDGGAGDDVIEIKGKLGATVWGGAGNDNIKGGDGDDVLLGGEGNDTIDGRKGNDVIVGGEGMDKLIGGDGKDVLIAGDLADLFFAAAMEFYSAASGEDALRKLGDDWASSRVNPDLADNNSDQDVLDEAFDTLSGGSGADWFIIDYSDKISDVDLNKLIDGMTKDGDKVTII